MTYWGYYNVYGINMYEKNSARMGEEKWVYTGCILL